MKFKPTDPASFSYKWMMKKKMDQILVSNLFKIKKSVFKNLKFFNELFPDLKQIASAAGKLKSEYAPRSDTLVGTFELKELDLDYMIKFKLVDNENLIIKIAWPLNLKNHAMFIMETFYYLLKY